MSLALLEEAASAACAAASASDGPEDALRTLLRPLHATLGRRTGDLDLPEGTAQFLVAGAFIVTPDEAWHMLTGNIGFPPEQTRLMTPSSAAIRAACAGPARRCTCPTPTL